MDALRNLCSKLDPPWDDRTFTSVGRCLEPTFAVVTSVSATVIECQKIPFHFFEGLQPDQAFEKTRIFTSQPIDIKPTQMIGFKDFLQVNTDYHETATSVLWFISSYEKHAPIHFVHMFSGSFCGWHQAARSLEQAGILVYGSSVHVDSDEDVMAVWSKAQRSDMYYKDVPIHTSKSTVSGVLSVIGKHHWLNLSRSEVNAIFTASPPCQPWSRGGKERGLEDWNGQSFVDSIVAVHHGRPIMLLLECTEKTWKHAHFQTLQTLLSFIGYKRVWQDEVETKDLTHMNRKRWLAIWVRKDQDAEMFNGSFKLFDPAKLPWSHPLFRFEVPNQVAEQLKLSPSLQSFYGNPQFLAKGSDRSMNEAMTLSSRCLDLNASVPTLCASYSMQHDLPPSHLENKGLFTFLVPSCGEFYFMDPFVLTALMGMTVDTTVAMASKIPICFQQLGNAIHTVHAALAIALGLAALKMHNQSVKSLVVSVWERHINCINTVLVCGQDFMWIIPDQRYKQDFELLQNNFSGKGISIAADRGQPIKLQDMRVSEFLRQAGFDLTSKTAFKAECIEHIDHTTMLTEVCGQTIRILRDEVEIVSLSIASVHQHSPITVIDTPSPSQLIIRDFLEKSEQLHEYPMKPTQLFQDPAQNNLVKVAVFHAGTGACDFLQGDPDRLQEQIRDAYPDMLIIRCRSHCIYMPDVPCFIAHHLVFDQIPILLVDGTFSHARAIMTPAQWTPEETFQGILQVKNMCVNADPSDATTMTTFSTGDVVTFFQQVPISRDALASQQGAKMGSDEAQWICEHFQALTSKAVMLPPCIIKYDCEAAGNKCLQPFSHRFHEAKKLRIPVYMMMLLNDHWSAVEVHFHEDLVHVKLVSCRLNETKTWTLKCIARIFNLQTHDLSVEWVSLAYPKDMCGWAIVYRWNQEFQLPFNSTIQGEVSGLTDEVTGRANQSILQFAKDARFSFLQTPAAWTKNPAFGGVEDDKSQDIPMEAAAKDPWMVKDPWTRSRARWEDLKLLPDHPFVDSSGKRLTFRPKQQLLGSQGGIAFVNKNGIAEIMANPPTETTAIIIPYADKNAAFQHVVPSYIQGPYEITAQDPVSQEVYKRMIMTIQVTSKHEFKLPESSYQGVLESVSELVIEADSRLTTKDFIAGFHVQGLEHFKLRIAEQFPSVKQISVYGFRKVSLDKEQYFFQVTCRIPKQFREQFLAKSGLGELTCRDYVDKEADPPADVSVIPRFFECSRMGKQTLLKASADCKGFAGIIVTRRGLAARSWSGQISFLRNALLPNDPRITDDNRDVAPRFLFNSYGWPTHISPQEVVRATLHYTKLGAVPTRCSRNNGVVCWTLGFAHKPPVEKFAAAFNQVPVEIVLSPAGQEISPMKKTKSKRQQKPQADSKKQQGIEKTIDSEAKSTADDARLTTLEAKMANLEKRQDSIESKMDTGFDAVQSQLRQLLNLAKPRHADPGATPPPKSHKAA